MFTISKTGKNLQDIEQVPEEQTADSNQSFWATSLQKIWGQRPRRAILDERVQQCTTDSLRHHWSEALLAARHYCTFERSTWPKREYRLQCEKLEKWCTYIYLPSQMNRTWRAVRSKLLATSAFEPENTLPEQISELAALATIELCTCVRPPWSALEDWAQSPNPSKRAERELRRWIDDLQHYCWTLDSLTLHIGLREIARRLMGKRPQEVESIPMHLVHARLWATLEEALEQRGLRQLRSSMTAFATHLQEVLQKKCLERAGGYSLLKNTQDLLSEDVLGKALSLVQLTVEERDEQETWAIIAKSHPEKLMQILREWPKLAQLAQLPHVAEIDPLGRFLLFCPASTTSEKVLAGQTQGLAIQGPLDQSPPRPNLSAYSQLFSRLRQNNWGLGTEVWPLRENVSGKLCWSFPPTLEPFCFEQMQRMMRKVVPEGQQLAQLAQRSGISECREAQECRYAVRVAIDGRPFDWKSRGIPWHWSTALIAGIEELYYSVFALRQALALRIKEVYPTKGDEDFEIQELFEKFDRLACTAHANAGFGLTLHRVVFTEPGGAFRDFSVLSGPAQPSIANGVSTPCD